MRIAGYNKLTLLDFPGKMACTVFLAGCNMRCPFCHNASLVINPTSQPDISQDEFFAFLKKRKGMLEGVCVTGGEP
ncbi:MAG: 4Fe-4S cluster-binding domain-containing protein, partial [Clostridia bacterium]|nr:4Fe-4S cluster-binding domain-containing protein [Clostridia bacterium]